MSIMTENPQDGRRLGNSSRNVRPDTFGRVYHRRAVLGHPEDVRACLAALRLCGLDCQCARCRALGYGDANGGSADARADALDVDGRPASRDVDVWDVLVGTLLHGALARLRQPRGGDRRPGGDAARGDLRGADAEAVK